MSLNVYDNEKSEKKMIQINIYIYELSVDYSG